MTGTAAVVSWQVAHGPGQDPASLDGEEVIGYGVDAGTGCFAGVEAARILGRVLADDGGRLADPVSRALLGHPSSGVVLAAQDGAPPAAVFTTGWGGGLYPTWLWMDDAGGVGVVVTDFLLADHPSR